MSRPSRVAVVLLLGIVAVSLNLRAPLLAVPPLLDDIRARTGMSGAVASLLTTLPVLCFGLLAPLGPRLARRFGLEPVIAGTMVVVLLGSLVRLVPSVAVLLLGTIVIGGAIAVANVLVPSVIKRDLPHRAGPALGIYSMALNVGAALGAGLTVPLRDAFGLTFREALALWGALALLALLAWAPVLRARLAPQDRPEPEAHVGALWRDPVARGVSLFFALQTLQFYGAATWLPTIFTDAGLSEARAGAMLSIFSLVGALSALVVPVLAGRAPTQSHLGLAVAALYVVGWIGMLAAPVGGAIAWMVLLGLAQGGGIGLALTLFVLRAPDAAHTAQLSGMAQTLGYLGGAVGPLLLGLLHDVTGGWTVPVALLLALAGALGVAGVVAGRDRQVRAPKW